MVNLIEKILQYNDKVPMIFTHWSFWVFFLVVLVGFNIFHKKIAMRNCWLFIASLFFYYKCGGYFFFLLVFSTLVDYTVGWCIYNSNIPSRRKFFLFISIFVNLLLLGFFKYSYFVIDITNTILGTHFHVVNYIAVFFNSIASTNFDINTIILPVGISFYTFQTISYSVDVYRYKVKPVKNIMDFGFYVSFFPQLVAGPIVRASEFVPQIYRKYKLNAYEFGFALFLILNGLIKKIIISDYISVNFVDRVFNHPLLYSGFENLMAVYGYSIQIYCDFSGYTDIAIGIALLMGFRLPENFRSPYKAESITDFWRRWHISLSSWLKDYLYIPLGGNRKGKLRTYTNLLITMILGGLWHGSNMRFVIWGAIHGVALAIDKLIKSLIRVKPKTNFSHFIRVFLTFNIVSFAWIFFRANSTKDVEDMINQLFFHWNGVDIIDYIHGYLLIFITIVFAYIIHWLPQKIKDIYIRFFIRMPWYYKLACIVVVVFALYQAQSSDIQPFIYFRF